MEFPTVLLLAVGLAMDCFAVSLGLGTTGYITRPRPALRLAFHFGLFQALMPILGWAGGYSIERIIRDFDHWIAFGLLAFIGLRMIRAGLSPEDGVRLQDPSRGRNLVMLSIATSIDALAVGLSLAALRVTILYPAVVIGVTTLALSLAALFAGRRLGTALGHRMQILGGLILLGIGLRVLLSHLL
jgi:putative Mn2+ efflux pump MntP